METIVVAPRMIRSKDVETDLDTEISLLDEEQVSKLSQLEELGHTDKQLNLWKLTIYKWDVKKAVQYYKKDQFCLEYCIEYKCKNKKLCKLTHDADMRLFNIIEKKQDFKYGQHLCEYFLSIPKYSNNSMLYRYYGLIHQYFDKLDKCQELYIKSLKIDPQNFSAHNEYAIFLKNKRKDFEGAKNHFQKAISLKPNDHIYYGNTAHLLCIEMKKYQESLIYSKKALMTNNKYTNAMYLQGEAYYHLKKWSLALKYYKKTLESGGAKYYEYNTDIIESRVQEIEMKIELNNKCDQLLDEITGNKNRLDNDDQSKFYNECIDAITNNESSPAPFSQILYFLKRFDLSKDVLIDAIKKKKPESENNSPATPHRDRDHSISMSNYQRQTLIQDSILATIKECIDIMINSEMNLKLRDNNNNSNHNKQRVVSLNNDKTNNNGSNDNNNNNNNRAKTKTEIESSSNSANSSPSTKKQGNDNNHNNHINLIGSKSNPVGSINNINNINNINSSNNNNGKNNSSKATKRNWKHEVLQMLVQTPRDYVESNNFRLKEKQKQKLKQRRGARHRKVSFQNANQFMKRKSMGDSGIRNIHHRKSRTDHHIENGKELRALAAKRKMEEKLTDDGKFTSKSVSAQVMPLLAQSDVITGLTPISLPCSSSSISSIGSISRSVSKSSKSPNLRAKSLPHDEKENEVVLKQNFMMKPQVLKRNNSDFGYRSDSVCGGYESDETNVKSRRLEFKAIDKSWHNDATKLAKMSVLAMQEEVDLFKYTESIQLVKRQEYRLNEPFKRKIAQIGEQIEMNKKQIESNEALFKSLESECTSLASTLGNIFNDYNKARRQLLACFEKCRNIMKHQRFNGHRLETCKNKIEKATIELKQLKEENQRLKILLDEHRSFRTLNCTNIIRIKQKYNEKWNEFEKNWHKWEVAQIVLYIKYKLKVLDVENDGNGNNKNKDKNKNNSKKGKNKNKNKSKEKEKEKGGADGSNKKKTKKDKNGSNEEKEDIDVKNSKDDETDENENENNNGKENNNECEIVDVDFDLFGSKMKEEKYKGKYLIAIDKSDLESFGIKNIESRRTIYHIFRALCENNPIQRQPTTG